MEAEGIPIGQSAEVAPGVVVERRSFLGLAAAAFGLASTRGAGLGQDPGPILSLEEFLEEVVPVARELKQDPSPVGEDRYLLTLASYAVRLGDVAQPEWRPSGQGEDTFIGVSWVGDPFIVLHWRMEPRSRIRLHAHTYGNVVTVGLEGQAQVRNFETLDEPDFDSSQAVRLRLTTSQILAPRSINLVPLSHGFVHGFQAGPQGARGLDITTQLRERRPTPYLELEETPVEPEDSIFMGRWTE